MLLSAFLAAVAGDEAVEVLPVSSHCIAMLGDGIGTASFARLRTMLPKKLAALGWCGENFSIGSLMGLWTEDPQEERPPTFLVVVVVVVDGGTETVPHGVFVIPPPNETNVLGGAL